MNIIFGGWAGRAGSASRRRYRVRSKTILVETPLRAGFLTARAAEDVVYKAKRFFINPRFLSGLSDVLNGVLFPARPGGKHRTRREAGTRIFLARMKKKT